MKKILSLLLVAAMFASLMSVSAMADDGTTIDFDGVGVTLTIPDSYFDTNGILAPTEGEELGYNTGWFYLDMGYVAMTQDEYEALLGQDELTDADIALYRSSLGTLFSIYAVADGASLDGMIDMLRSYGLNLDTNNLSEIHARIGAACARAGRDPPGRRTFPRRPGAGRRHPWRRGCCRPSGT
jgi:hypothetical protein